MKQSNDQSALTTENTVHDGKRSVYTVRKQQRETSSTLSVFEERKDGCFLLFGVRGQTHQLAGWFPVGLTGGSVAAGFRGSDGSRAVLEGVGPLLFWQKVANGSRSKGTRKRDRSSKMVANALRWLPGWRGRGDAKR